MKLSIITNIYKIADRELFEKFLILKGVDLYMEGGESALSETTVDFDALAHEFKDGNFTADMLADVKSATEEEEEKRRAIASMLITSGFNFDGYKVVKYSGYISGDDAISVDRGVTAFGVGGSTNVKNKLMDSLAIIRRNALQELKEAAYDLGCNAVIGVDFDYLTLDPQTTNIINGATTYQPYIFGVTANGNAVVIEKID